MNRCVIIGAGPGGMSAALYLKRSGIMPIIIDDMPGGELLKLGKIDNYLGLQTDGITLAMNMINQLKENGISIVKDRVTLVSKCSSGFKVCLKKGGDIFCSKVILSSGKKPKLLGINGEDKLIGHGISYCAVCDGAFYRGKDVCVVGSGDGAFSEALYLSKLCNKVYILARSDLRASNDLISKTSNSNIFVLKNSSIASFIYEDSISGVILSDGKQLEVSGIFVSIGGVPQSNILDFSVDMKDGYIITDENMESSVKGFYAIGDVRLKKFYQISIAVAEGAIAALNVGDDVDV